MAMPSGGEVDSEKAWLVEIWFGGVIITTVWR